MKLSKFLVIPIIFICLVNISSKKSKMLKEINKNWLVKQNVELYHGPCTGLKLVNQKYSAYVSKNLPKLKIYTREIKKETVGDFNMKFSSHRQGIHKYLNSTMTLITGLLSLTQLFTKIPSLKLCSLLII
jgi:hypothetical protein